VDDVLQVLHRSREPVDARNDQRVALAQEVEQNLQLGTRAPLGSRLLFRPDRLATGRTQCRDLNIEVLVCGGHARIAEKRHGSPDLFHQLLDRARQLFDIAASDPDRTLAMSQVGCAGTVYPLKPYRSSHARPGNECIRLAETTQLPTLTQPIGLPENGRSFITFKDAGGARSLFGATLVC
jgi:hypothetical protein